MATDIENREDIERLLDEFYKVAVIDGEIGHHFDSLDLIAHLPVISDFWEKVLFGRPVYFNNPLAVHQVLHARSPLLPEHFSRWVVIFRETVDRLFQGEMAEMAKLRAFAIGHNLNHRLNGRVVIEGTA